MRRKSGFLLLIAGMITLGIMGCAMRKENDRERLLSYMKNKYSEEFSYVESYAGQLGKNYMTILVESQKYPERRALARLSVQKGKNCFEDNYLAFLMKEDIEEEMGQLAEACFGECRITYKIPQFVFPSDFLADMTAEQFLSEPSAMAQFDVYPKESEGEEAEWEQKLDNFRKKNVEKGYQIRGTLHCGEKDLVFSMDERGAFQYMRWLQ